MYIYYIIYIIYSTERGGVAVLEGAEERGAERGRAVHHLLTLGLRTTTSQKCAAVPRRARI